MKTIFVPVDFSKYSENALEVAADLAKKHGSRIILAHMLEIANSYLTKDQQQEVFNVMYYIKIADQHFKELRKKEYLKGIEVVEVMKPYRIFSEINTIAAEHDSDLIVMGSHGATGVKEVFIGSNTEKVVRTADIPVLVIKERSPDFHIDKAVFVTDFDDSNQDTFKRARKFFSYFDVELKLLYINIPEKFMSTAEIKRNAHNFMSTAGIDPSDFDKHVVFYADYTAERGVFNYCEEAKIDAIAISTHGRKGLGHFFYGSVGEDVANHADVPVITFKI